MTSIGEHSASSDTAVAVRAPREFRLDAQHPSGEWRRARPLQFSQDWQGKNADDERLTEVRLLWTPATLYVRFFGHFRELFTFDDSDRNGRRDHLWDRDVAEVFLQPDPSRPRYYKEFEISPNGMWIDLDIVPEGHRDLHSMLQHSAWLDSQRHIWAAELSIPMHSLTEKFDPALVWRVNFYRVEGRSEPRFYSAWRATETDVPNFHVPDRFGKLRFESPENALKPR